MSKTNHASGAELAAGDVERLLVSPWQKLSADPFVRIQVALLLASVVWGYLPFVSPYDRETYSLYYAPLPMLFLVIVAVGKGLARISQREERSFWTWLLTGHVLYVASSAGYAVFRHGRGSDAGNLAVNVLGLLYLMAVLIAIECRPHRKPGWSERVPLARPAVLSSLVFGFALLAYFNVIPASLDKTRYYTWLPTSYAYLFLDGLLALLFFNLRRRLASSRWRTIYGLMGVAFVLWTLSDILTILNHAKIVRLIAATWTDVFYYAPFVPSIMAARARETPLGDEEKDEAEESNLGELASVVPSSVFSFLLPVLHIGLYAAGLLSPVTRDARSVVVLVCMPPIFWLAWSERRVLRSQRLKAEKAHSEIQHRFELLFEFAPDACYLNDLSGNLLDGNRAAEKMTGYGKDELIGKNFLEAGILPFHELGKAAAALARNAAGLPTGPDELTLIHKDGSQITVEVRALPMTFEGRRLVMGIARDVTERKQATERALHESQERFRLVWENATDGMRLTDEDGKVVAVNAAFCRLIGKPREDIEGHSMAAVYAVPDQEPVLRKHQERFRNRDVPAYLERQLQLWDGRTIWVEVSNRFIEMGPSEPLLLGIFRDITERKRAEAAVRESHERFEKLVNDLNDVVWSATPDGSQILDLNHSFEKLYGVSAEAFRANPRLWIETVHPDDRSIAEESGRRLFAHGRASAEYRIVRPNGEVRWILDRKSLICGEDGQPVRMGGIAEDITERKQTEEMLRRLTADLLRAQDEERRRVAREMHDTTGQDLAALRIRLQQLLGKANKFDLRTRALIEEATTLAEGCVDSVRTMSYLLHPPLLDELGLETALRWLADGFAERTGIAVDMRLASGRERLSPDAELALFRVAQESLTNILRHSGGRTCRVEMRRQPDAVILEVEDFGEGMPAAVLETIHIGVATLGVGINGMRERLRYLGGRLEVTSSGHGTIVRAFLPVQQWRQIP